MTQKIQCILFSDLFNVFLVHTYTDIGLFGFLITLVGLCAVRGRDGSFNSERLSFLSIISEDSATCFQDPIKAYTCSFVNTQTLESDYLEMEETSQKSISYTGRDVCSTLYYSLLMENLYVLESTFSDSDVLRLEREILLQLGKIGALKLFNNCLSETVKTSNVFDLSDAPTEDIEDHKMNVSVDDHMGKILIPSKRKGRRKMRMARVSEKSNQTSFLSSPSKAMQEGSKQLTVSSPKSALNSKSRRSMLARNEAELSKGVKVVFNFKVAWLFWGNVLDMSLTVLPLCCYRWLPIWRESEQLWKKKLAK